MGEQNRDGDELFGETCRQEIGKILGVLNDERFPAFWDILRRRGLEMRQTITLTPNSFRISPLNITATQRIEWLNTNVVNPIDRLEAASANELSVHFRHWEQSYTTYNPLDEELIQQLREVRHKAEGLIRVLENEIEDSISHGSEIRFDIVYNALGDLHDHFPEIKLSRGNWDKLEKQHIGQVPAYVRRVFLEITQQNEQLDGVIKDVISDFRKNQRIFS